jgi:hypothetical protein
MKSRAPDFCMSDNPTSESLFDPNGGSPILKEQAEHEAAPFLFSPETINSLTEAERRGEYTLERLRKLRPEAIDETIRLRGQCVGQLRIAKLLRLHHRTIAAIDRAYPERIEAERRNRVAMLRTTADTLVELVAENPDSVPPNVRCLAASQLYDKAQILDGAATANLAIDVTSHVDYTASLKKFEEITQEIQALHAAGTIDIARYKELGWSALEALENETGFGGRKESVISQNVEGAGD